jgi:FkbM family methyltransferase
MAKFSTIGRWFSLCIKKLEVSPLRLRDIGKTLLNERFSTGIFGRILWPIIGRLNCLLTYRQFFNKVSIQGVADILEDERSRHVFRSIVQYQKGRVLHQKSNKLDKLLDGIVDDCQYFDKAIVTPKPDAVYIDGGAFDGGTAVDFIRFCNSSYKKIYCFEPDATNAANTKANLSSYQNVEVVSAGLWSEPATLAFSKRGSASSTFRSNSADLSQEMIRVVSVDSMTLERPVTFIKLDVEGAETQAIKGAQNTIKHDKPTLAICLYHRIEDLFEIPHMIKSLAPEYKLYVRHYTRGVYETVLYAIL